MSFFTGTLSLLLFEEPAKQQVWVVVVVIVPCRVLFIRAPHYYFGDLKMDTHAENYLFAAAEPTRGTASLPRGYFSEFRRRPQALNPTPLTLSSKPLALNPKPQLRVSN